MAATASDADMTNVDVEVIALAADITNVDASETPIAMRAQAQVPEYASKLHRRLVLRRLILICGNIPRR
jgi:hypothetical protein